MRLFRPSLWSNLALVFVGWGLLSLGFWQVDRGYEMSEKKKSFDQATAAAPAEVSKMEHLSASEPWRRVRVKGRYTGEQGRVINKYIDGELGVWLAAVLQLVDGGYLVVMRGWVPESDRIWAPPKGDQELLGMIQSGSADLAATLSNGTFRSLDAHAVLTHFKRSPGYGRLLIEGELVPSGKAFPEPLPRRGFYANRIRRPHREYAGTWFGLAVALFGIWLYAGLRRGQVGEEA
jgi:surfeit locus 1 family protein